MKINLLNTILMPIDLVENQNVIANEVKQSKNRLLRRFTPRNVGKKAFTLAEVLITLTILGVVAAITIPAMMNNQGERANRTKVKKAIANYEQAVENMRIANDLKTAEDITSWATCSNVKEYFKIKKDLGDCKFLTNDNLYWDVTNFAKKDDANTIISLDKDCTSIETDEKKACYNKAFKLTFENSSDGRSITYNKVSGAACATLKFAKILGDDTTCSSNTPTGYTAEQLNTYSNTLCTAEKTTGCIQVGEWEEPTLYSSLDCSKDDEEGKPRCGSGYAETIIDSNGNTIVKLDTCGGHLACDTCEDLESATGENCKNLTSGEYYCNGNLCGPYAENLLCCGIPGASSDCSGTCVKVR